jgi:hypothetical protein
MPLLHCQQRTNSVYLEIWKKKKKFKKVERNMWIPQGLQCGGIHIMTRKPPNRKYLIWKTASAIRGTASEPTHKKKKQKKTKKSG